MADGQAIEYQYKQSPYLSGMERYGVDGIERRYLTGYADLMLICPWSVSSSCEEALELMQGIDLDQLMLGLHGAYIASALQGEAISIYYSKPEDGLGFSWEFDAAASFLTQNGRDGWIALESLPIFRKHYDRYRRVIEGLPDLLLRLEIIDIEDKGLGKRTGGMTDAEVQAKAEADAKLMGEVFRNDGFLIHGPEKTITIHHRRTDAIIPGIEELKKNILASTDYTDNHLWGNNRQSGLAGITQQERDAVLVQCNIRLNRCWRPVVQQVLNNIIDYYGLDAEVKIEWGAPYEGDAREMAEAEFYNARASKIRVTSKIMSEVEERGRFLGTGRPSPYPKPDKDTAPEICKVDCNAVINPYAAGGNAGGRQRGPNGQFLPSGGASGGMGAIRDGGDGYQVTKGMIKAAARGLELRRVHKRGGTIVGVSRARDISNDRQLSLSTVKRMYSYFSRHAVDKMGAKWKTGESAGYIAWMLWGGDDGFAWCKSIRERTIKAGTW
jgi:hypothetical protein